MRKLLLSLAVIGAGISAGAWYLSQERVTEHQVHYVHPGAKEGESAEHTLMQISTGDGPDRFYMDVNSVFCGEEICKVDRVRTFWDELGAYAGIELKPGIELEKAEGEDFNAKDYAKLDRVLSLADSDLAAVTHDQMLDAYTGATIQLNEEHYVEGAVWTCFTLWHWVHGAVSDAIRNISGDERSTGQLRQLLTEGEPQQQRFALQQLIRRKADDTKSQHSVLELLPEVEGEFQDEAFAYVEQLPASDYFSTVEGLLTQDNESLSMRTLASLQQSEAVAPKGFYSRLGQKLMKIDSYSLLRAYLRLFQEKSVIESEVRPHLVELLNHTNFLVARNVYWLLSGLEPKPQEQAQLQAFAEQNRERL